MATTSSKSMMAKLRDFFAISNKDNSEIRRELGSESDIKDIASFENTQKKEGAFDSRERGVQTVKLSQITGSVGRYQDFDDKFRFKSQVPSERFTAILEAMRCGTSLPPVKLYQIKDEYYVLDGNHRVAAAKKLNHDEILATILEFIPSSETLDNVLYKEMMDFCDRTGLPRSIKLTEVGQYQNLLEQIHEHHEYLRNSAGITKNNFDSTFLNSAFNASSPAAFTTPITFASAARDWYKTIYQPFCSIIKRGNIVETFPDRTLSDLYVYISFGHWKRKRPAQYGIGLGKLIPETMEEFRIEMKELNEVEYPEMKQSITAFVLMIVRAKHEYKIIEKLFELDEIVEIHAVHGDADLLIKVRLSRDLLSSDAEVISNFVHEKMRQLNGVVSSKTLIPGLSRIKPV
ncbi:MAG: Lrp/AsnC ligand binding domain-containing protein [Desulfamplus sp.]|nr:Lrp/AsnC ligand binding domain-containing protein [Desulfamplus sp.]